MRRLIILLGLLMLIGSVSALTYNFNTDLNYTNQWFNAPPLNSVGIANIQGSLNSIGNIVGGKQNFTGHFTLYQCSGNDSIWYSFYRNWTLGYNISYNTAAGTTVQARRIQQAGYTYNISISNDNKTLTIDLYVTSITQNDSTIVGAVRFYGLSLNGFQFGGTGSYYLMSNMSLDYSCGGTTTTSTTTTTTTTTLTGNYLSCGFINPNVAIDSQFIIYANITDVNPADVGNWWYTLRNDTGSYSSINFYGSLNGSHSDEQEASILHIGVWTMTECNMSNDSSTVGMIGGSNPTLDVSDTTTTTTMSITATCSELCVSSGFDNESTNCTAIWGGCGARYFFTGEHTSDCPVSYCCCFMNQTTTSTTLPSSNQNTLLVSVHKSVLFRNESFVLYAMFWDRDGTLIEGADCNYAADGSVVNLSQAVVYSMRFEPSNWVNVYPLSINSNAAGGSSRIYVTCNLSGYITTQNSTLITVNAGSGGIAWNQKLVSGVQRSSHSVIVSFRDSGGNPIGGICNLSVDGIYQDLCAVGFSGLCSIDYYYLNLGSHSYSVSCAGSGVSIQTLSDSFTISQSSGLTTSTTLKRTVPDHCDNGYQDGGETDIDCGGSCYGCNLGGECIFDSDCSRGVCEPRNKICQAPNCPDGYSRTHNFFIDCGAPSCPACECGSDMSLTGCDTSGFEHCNATIGKCVTDYCLDNTQCPALLIDGNVRPRICIDNECRFSSSTPYLNSSTAMQVYPLSGIVFGQSGNYFYLGVCGDHTDGLRVVTREQTHTQYLLSTPANSPAIPATSSWSYFGVNGTDKSARIPEFCNWFGDDFRYALVEFHSETGGAAVSSIFVPMVIEKRSFKASCYLIQTGVLECNLTRDGTCFARSGGNPLVSLGVNGTLFRYNVSSLSNISSFPWFCNSSYGEPVSGTATSAVSSFIAFTISGSISILLSMISYLTGIDFNSFVWKSEYTILVMYGLIILLPILSIVLERKRNVKSS